MQRMIQATRNSARAFGHLFRHEAAFRQEVILLVVAIPLAWIISGGWRGFALLIGVLVILIVVEVVNTAIEAACNAATREFSDDVMLAKDCGSLAVAFALALAGVVWLIALWEWLAGAPI
ncbi:MAG: diacylglycerol kinase [Rhizobiaceae bacterium]|nr:diacylglycerol kinase [Rhizobiaceae bacterium]MCV0408226.1 diacylglycerol kinase [Rhizobiaceae bacterium]